LGELPESGLGHLPNLRVLNLEFNRLQRLPAKVFQGLSKLKVLWLTGNHYNPEEQMYKRMKKAGNRLEDFDASRNPLSLIGSSETKCEELHKDLFKGLDGLQVLLLHHNALRELPGGLFSGLRKLRVLKLLDNPFKPNLSTSHDAFAGLLEEDKNNRALQQLDLKQDSGDSLEDHWEETRTYLSDDFKLGRLPKTRGRDEDL